jgi:ATP-dependent Clp protease adaptor protein ClpS
MARHGKCKARHLMTHPLMSDYDKAPRPVAQFDTMRPLAQLDTIRPLAQSQDTPDDGEGDLSVALKTRPKSKRPPMYKVMLLNDDYTPMEFVVHILERFFGMTHAQAFEIMLTVHKKGVAVVGVFSHEIAETKVTQVMDFARRHQHPLQCTMEKE